MKEFSVGDLIEKGYSDSTYFFLVVRGPQKDPDYGFEHTFWLELRTLGGDAPFPYGESPVETVNHMSLNSRIDTRVFD